MKLLLPSVLVLLSVAQALCEESISKEDPDYWSQDNQIIQDGWPATDPLREILRRWTRKPRPNQFVGLMGKRSPANAQIQRKRHKINSFVGLMGKRSQEEPDLYDWSTIQDLDRRR